MMSRQIFGSTKSFTSFLLLVTTTILLHFLLVSLFSAPSSILLFFFVRGTICIVTTQSRETTRSARRKTEFRSRYCCFYTKYRGDLSNWWSIDQETIAIFLLRSLTPCPHAKAPRDGAAFGNQRRCNNHRSHSFRESRIRGSRPPETISPPWTETPCAPTSDQDDDKPRRRKQRRQCWRSTATVTSATTTGTRGPSFRRARFATTDNEESTTFLSWMLPAPSHGQSTKCRERASENDWHDQ